MPCSASSRGRSVPPTARSRSRSARRSRAAPSTRTTPAQPSGVATAFPMCSSRVITAACKSGGSSAAASEGPRSRAEPGSRGAAPRPQQPRGSRYHPCARVGRRAVARSFVMSTIIDTLEREQLRERAAFDPGDRVRVHFQVIEGTRRRTQVFEGTVLKRQGSGARETFTVRKQSFGVGVERTFPLHSPKIEHIEIAARGDVRRAKLYYLRGRVGKRARVRERRYTGPEEVVERGLLYDPAAEAAAAADAEVPGEAVDAQALAEAEVADTTASTDAEAAPAGDEQAG